MLRGKDMSRLPCIEDAYMVIEDGIIAESDLAKNRKPKKGTY